MLRLAEERDLDAMRTWRNQQANRAVSIHEHVISPEEHLAWWGRVQQDPTRRCLVFEYDGRPLGVVNFFDIQTTADSGTTSGSWGFFLDHDTTSADGTAMMAWMQVMREATDYAFDELGLDVLHGEVRPGNDAVRMMNRRFRFTEGEPVEQPVGDTTVTLIPITLRATDRRRRKAKQ